MALSADEILTDWIIPEQCLPHVYIQMPGGYMSSDPLPVKVEGMEGWYVATYIIYDLNGSPYGEWKIERLGGTVDYVVTQWFDLAQHND